MSWARALACVLAGSAIGCGTNTLEPNTDAGGGGGSIGSDARANGDSRVFDAALVADVPIWTEPCGNGRLDLYEDCDHGDTIPGRRLQRDVPD